MAEQHHRDHDLLRKALSSGEGCLSLRQLEMVASAATCEPRVVAHLKACPRCQAELSLLEQFEEAKPLPDEGAAAAWIAAKLGKAPGGQSPAKMGSHSPVLSWLRSITARPIALAAFASVLLLAGGILVFRSGRASEPEIRAGLVQPGDVVRSQSFRIVSPIGDVEQTPTAFKWEASPGAARYRVTLMEVDHTIVWAGETRDSAISLPAAALQKIIPAKTLFWQVTALDANGRAIATSSVERFRLIIRR